MSIDANGAMDFDKALKSTGSKETKQTEQTPIKSGLIGAISTIQEYHVFEKKLEKGEEIDSNFFTIKQVLDFVRIGFKSGFWESFFFVLILPVVEVIYPTFKLYFLHERISPLESLATYFLSYFIIGMMTLWLISIVRFYNGNITRKAILSLFLGRGLAFLFKGGIIYLFFLWAYHIAVNNQEAVYGASVYLGSIFNLVLSTQFEAADFYNYFMLFIAPAIKHISNVLLTAMIFFGILPFFAVLIKGLIKTRKAIKNEESYEQY